MESNPFHGKTLPKHIAIIMDGNGRWAKSRGLERIFGHRHAIKSVKEVTSYCGNIGIEYLTLFVFSTENWSRPQIEVNALMDLFVSTINDYLEELNNNNVIIDFIGDDTQLPKHTLQKLIEAKEKTKNNTGLTLILALNYSGKWDLAQAMKNIGKEIEKGKLSANDINENTINDYLTTKNFPQPELLIRTSGEIRISNFFLWQIAYSELYFTDVLWPDFRKQHIEAALNEYFNRERRFGKTSEQLTNR